MHLAQPIAAASAEVIPFTDGVFIGKASLALRDWMTCGDYVKAITFGYRMIRELRRMEWEIARLNGGRA